MDRVSKKCRRKDSISDSMARDTKGSSHAEGDPGFQQIYEPRVISISPYHHGKPHLHPGEMIKPLCAPNFLDDSKQDIEALYTKIESNMRQWKSAMIGVVQTSMMMLLDGCFLLQFIRSKEYDSKVDMSNVHRNHRINFVVQDLFLLENQLPFGILKWIFEGAKFNDGSPMKRKIKKIGH